MTVTALGKDTELGGRYRLTGRIATGGMGEVWRAEDTLLHRKVAVKVLKSELTSDPTFLERFRAEARNTAALSHPGIAAVHDYGEVDSGGLRTAYLVMELVEGEPLSAILAREGRLPTARVLHIVGQAAAALEAAHRTGMVHRDVKPGNVLVGADDTVKITDFGIARVADTVPLTQAGMVVGTAQYFAPEQAEGKLTSPASDVYSLAVVAYECLAGRLPFEADSSVAVAVMQIRNAAPPLPEDVPPPVRAVIARAMAKDPALRFRTGGEFAAALHALRDGLPGDATAMMVAPPPHATQVLPGPIGTPTGAVAGPPPGALLGPPPPPVGGPSTSGVHLPPPHLRRPPRRRGLVWLVVVVLAAAAALGAAAAVVAARDQPGSGQPLPDGTGSAPAGGQERPPTQEAPPTQSPDPTLISVNLDIYRGWHVKDACRALTQLGLSPVVVHSDVRSRSDRVIAVRPDGQRELPPGSQVDLYVPARGPDSCPTDKDDDD